MKAPHVNSPALKKVVAAAAPRINRYTETLDKTSEDIKTVEKWLQDSGIRFPVEVRYLPNGFILGSSSFTLESGSAQRTICGLAWAPASDGKTWRLMYREYGVSAALGSEDQALPERAEVIAVRDRPVIETPAAVRLHVGEVLGRLVEQIAGEIPRADTDVMLTGEIKISRFEEGDLDVSFDPSDSPPETGPTRRFANVRNMLHELSSLGVDAAKLGNIEADLRRDNRSSLDVRLSLDRLRAFNLV